MIESRRAEPGRELDRAGPAGPGGSLAEVWNVARCTCVRGRPWAQRPQPDDPGGIAVRGVAPGRVYLHLLRPSAPRGPATRRPHRGVVTGRRNDAGEPSDGVLGLQRGEGGEATVVAVSSEIFALVNGEVLCAKRQLGVAPRPLRMTQVSRRGGRAVSLALLRRSLKFCAGIRTSGCPMGSCRALIAIRRTVSLRSRSTLGVPGRTRVVGGSERPISLARRTRRPTKRIEGTAQQTIARTSSSPEEVGLLAGVYYLCPMSPLLGYLEGAVSPRYAQQNPELVHLATRIVWHTADALGLPLSWHAVSRFGIRQIALRSHRPTIEASSRRSYSACASPPTATSNAQGKGFFSSTSRMFVLKPLL